MTVRFALAISCLFLPPAILLGAGVELPKNSSLPSSVRSLLDNKCVGCHQGAKAPGGFDLKTMEFDLNDAHSLDRWIRVHDVVRSGKMPPIGTAVLKPVERAAFLKTLAQPLTDFETHR